MRAAQIPTPLRPAMRMNKKVEMCAICCSDAPSNQAVHLVCRHGWYCVQCLKRHADATLAVGKVHVPCPECREPIQDYILKEILSNDALARLHKSSIDRAIANSSNLYTCPSPNCDMCVEVEEGEEPILKKCPTCKKGCCLRCGAQPYHKGMSCQEYALKKSKSKKLRAAEEGLRRWMRRTGTKQCPRCQMGVSKENIGNQNGQRTECHKMLCRHCGVKFCYQCLAILSDTYTCGCSIERHSFVNPVTGKAVQHLKKKTPTAMKKTHAGSKSSKASGRKSTGVRTKKKK